MLITPATKVYPVRAGMVNVRIVASSSNLSNLGNLWIRRFGCGSAVLWPLVSPWLVCLYTELRFYENRCH